MKSPHTLLAKLGLAVLPFMAGTALAVSPMSIPADAMNMFGNAAKSAADTAANIGIDAADIVNYHGAEPGKQMHEQMQKITSGDRFQFKPSYITVPGNRKLTEDDFEDPAICAGCHPRQYSGWKDSMHSKAFIDPVFQKLWHMGEEATGGKLLNHCGGCHSPIGVTTGTIKHDAKAGKFTAGPKGEQGVSCDVCHNISKTNFLDTASLEHGNGSFEIDPRGPGGRKLGPIKDAKSPYHATEYSPLHQKADFCGNCHQIFNPANGFPVERTYDEWKYSVYAREGIVCQDCHMNSVETAIEVAKQMKRPQDIEGLDLGGFAGMGASKKREIVHDHSFVGGNAVVTSLLGGGDSNAAAQAARKRLASAADVDVKFEKRKDGLHELRVEVTNKGAGHNLPTSLTDVREVWVEVTVKDQKGKVIYTSGHLDSHDELNYDSDTIYNSVAVNDKGDVTHKPWEVSRFKRDTTIPPKGHDISRYTFAAPKGTKKLTADVKLNYRSFSQHTADFILGKGAVKVPVIEMNHETATTTL